MILVGNSRGGARDLAAHLFKDENDHVEVHELRGFASDGLKDALSEIQAISKGTQCRQFMFALSMNPPRDETVSTEVFETTIEQIEMRLGLVDQPRAIVFHEKEGRRHAHVVWSRINADEMKAIHLPYSKRKLNSIARDLYLEHDWQMPDGFRDPSLSNPLNFTHTEWQQAKRSNIDPREIKQVFQSAWERSDSNSAFIAALEDKGYRLARGRKSFVAVDIHGEVYSVARQAKVKVRDLKARLGDPNDLPSVETVQAHYKADMAQRLEGLRKGLNVLSSRQAQDFKRRNAALIDRQREERTNLSEKQKTRWVKETKARQSRFRTGLKGIWDRLRGEHSRIAKQNSEEAKVAEARDWLEKSDLSQRHLSEKQSLKAQVRTLRERYAEQRQSLSHDIDQLRPMRSSPRLEP